MRDEQPEEHRHPETERVDGKDFYDEQQFRNFYTWFQEQKSSKVLKADPELYELTPETVVSINKTAELLGFAGASTIRKYQQANPGYFPDSVGEVEGPTGRMIHAFRVDDLQDFDRGRTGEKLGKAGRRPGPQPEAPVGRPSALEEVLAAELSARAGGEPLTATQLAERFAAEAIERDGYRPGLAAELSMQYGGRSGPGSGSCATPSSTARRPRRPARKPTAGRPSPWPPCASAATSGGLPPPSPASTAAAPTSGRAR